MNVKVGTDIKLLHMLGITQKNVLKADIRLRHDEIATVTLTCAADLDDTQLTTAQFTLWALDPQPKPATPPSLDLDAMCAAAQERLANATHLSAEWAKQYQQEESDAIHIRMNRALRHYKAAATLALSQLHPKGERLTALEAVRADAIELLFEAKTNVEKVDDIIRSDFLRMNAAKSPAARANP